MQQVLVRMEDDLKNDLQEFAKIADMTQNDFIVKAIQLAIYGTGDKLSTEETYVKLASLHAYTHSLLRNLVKIIADSGNAPEIADEFFERAREAAEMAKKKTSESLGLTQEAQE